MGKKDKTTGIETESEYMISEFLTKDVILIKFSKITDFKQDKNKKEKSFPKTISQQNLQVLTCTYMFMNRGGWMIIY